MTKIDKSWLKYNRADDKYLQGALNFVKNVEKDFGYPEKILCPCKTCRNLSHQNIHIVHEHLVTLGIDPLYTVWFHHGEQVAQRDDNDKNDGKSEAYNLLNAENIRCINDYLDCEETRDGTFKDNLSDAETPVYAGCTKHTKLSAIVTFYKLKTSHGWSNNSFDELLEVLNDLLPDGHLMPTSTYYVKTFLQKFDLGYEKIHACVNDCCLFTKENILLDKCPKCDTSRWKQDKHKKTLVGEAAKVLRYFPIIPRFRRMFSSEKMAENLRWHFINKSEDSKMRHPVDSVAWETIDEKWPLFSQDPRNLRLGLATDGFNPFSNLSTNYSCWPVMLVNYNLPPWLCMKKENILLTLLIPGRKQPGNDIDVYLEPLIDDLKLLWRGVDVYDVFEKTMFNLKAVLMWTISDFPAYGNVAGCTTKGRKICPICGEGTHSEWLKFSKKFSYRGHRRFLPPSHHFRTKKTWFDGKEEHDIRPRILTGSKIYDHLKDYVNNWGKGYRDQQRSSKKKRKTPDVNKCKEREPAPMWKKRSIFFDLPYWKELTLRHNLDVMHIEKNVCESIINTLLGIIGKSKDGINARKDLKEMGIRSELHPQSKGTRTYLPPSFYTLSKAEKRIFCKRLLDLKLPDGYSSNISNCVSIDPCKINSLKSHDCHVLIQQLLPVAIRGLLPKGPRDVIIKLCAFFNRVCQRVIDREKIMEYEDSIIEIVCLLERYFVPAFFDIMIHLVIHIGREVRLCGPVQFRWMYPFERYMKILKGYVRNYAKPEGCIAKCYLADECMEFCSGFIEGTNQIGQTEDRNADYDNDMILEGRPIFAGKQTILTSEMLEGAHISVLFNMAVVEPFLEMHLEELRKSNKAFEKNTTLLWKRHTEKFPSWLKQKMEEALIEIDNQDILRWLAYGPKSQATSYKGYVINGQRFHTKDAEKSTQNSGVSIEATTMCRSSFKDGAQVENLVVYYGVLQEILMLDYHAFLVPVFKCDWATVRNGVKVEDDFTLVNLKQAQNNISRDPFILATQAKQVFYSRDDETSDWYVVLRAPPRGFHELEKYDEIENATSCPEENPRIIVDVDNSTEVNHYVREDCEGLLV